MTQEMVPRVTPDQLDLPTPSPSGRSRQLLEHMIGHDQQLRRRGPGRARRRGGLGGPPVRRRDHGGVRGVLGARDPPPSRVAAWGTKGSGCRWCAAGRCPRPAAAISFAHFVDYVVHGWDVAVAIGVGPWFPPKGVAAVEPHVDEVPDGPNRRQAGASFRPGVGTDGEDPLDRIVAEAGAFAELAQTDPGPADRHPLLHACQTGLCLLRLRTAPPGSIFFVRRSFFFFFFRPSQFVGQPPGALDHRPDARVCRMRHTGATGTAGK